MHTNKTDFVEFWTSGLFHVMLCYPTVHVIAPMCARHQLGPGQVTSRIRRLSRSRRNSVCCTLSRRARQRHWHLLPSLLVASEGRDELSSLGCTSTVYATVSLFGAWPHHGTLLLHPRLVHQQIGTLACPLVSTGHCCSLPAPMSINARGSGSIDCSACLAVFPQSRSYSAPYN